MAVAAFRQFGFCAATRALGDEEVNAQSVRFQRLAQAVSESRDRGHTLAALEDMVTLATEISKLPARE